MNKQGSKVRGTKFWDFISRGYQNKPAAELKGSGLATAAKTLEHLNPADILLDVGCGPGTITYQLAEKVAQVHAIDISPGMIDSARQRAAAKQIDNIRFERSDLFDQKLKRNSFDVITAFNVLPYLPEPANSFHRIHDLLKPGGLFISATACLKEGHLPLRLLMTGLSKLRIMPPVRFFKIEALTAIIENGKFEVIAKEAISDLPEYFIVAKKNKKQTKTEQL